MRAAAAVVTGVCLLLAAGCSSEAGGTPAPSTPASASAGDPHADHSTRADHVLGTDGPLAGPREGSGILCTPPADGARTVFGDHFTNTGEEPLVITKVELLHPEGLDGIEHTAIPDVMKAGSYAGVRDDKPADPGLTAIWEARVDPVGLTVEPGTTANVLTIAQLPEGAAEGSSAGLVVRYMLDGVEEIEVSTWTYRISTEGC